MAPGGFTSFVLFAEMRTGSNFLESNLNAIEGITCHGEAFNPHFIGKKDQAEYLGIDLTTRGKDPARLLAAMRAQGPGLSGFRYFHDHDPRVFDLVMDDPACAKVILSRNPLESYISWKIARESDQWWMANTKHLKTARPAFDLAEFRARTAELQDFHSQLNRRLLISGQTAYRLDYEDILDLDVLNGLAAFLGTAGRLKALDFKFKKQNPQAPQDKVSNPAEMKKALATIDWFALSHSPDLEPGRAAGVPTYIAAAGIPLLFQPLRGGPEAQIRDWLAAMGALLAPFDRGSLRQWRAAHPGHRSFTVLRHPLARAQSAFEDLLRREPMAELRPYLQRVHRFTLPPKGEGFADLASYRAGFLVFLDLIRHILAGRTELRTPAQFATQLATLQGFGQLQSPDHLLREERLGEDLAHLMAGLNLPCPPLPQSSEPAQHPLEALYAPDIEAAARAAYARDYEAFGFADWVKI